MRAFKFDAKISSDGTIQIPFNPSLFDRLVEITIVPKSMTKRKKLSAKDFVNKWAGFIKSDNPELSKIVN